jgi:hypothetical protein
MSPFAGTHAASYNAAGPLAIVPTGCTMRVGHLVSETTRVLCDDLGLHEGDEVQCLGASREWVLCWTGEHHGVVLTRAFAAYVPVEPLVA